MTIKNKITRWNDKYPMMFAIIRLILGSSLAIRGVYFFIDAEPLYYLIKDSRLQNLDISMPLAMVISAVHILGGVFLVIGLFVKIAAWVQVPIVLGAIIFINTHNRLSFTYPGLLISIFVLMLLLLFAFEGGGEVAVDDYAQKNLL